VPALLAAAAGATASTPSRTEVVRWSPLDSAGWVKKALRVDFVPGGRCLDIGYTYVGGIAYRCSAGHGLFNACWREGPNPTEFVICTGDPWQSRVVRLRSPNLLLYPGVTHEKAATYPWAIELADGNRCTVVQGAHGAVRTHGRVFTVDYGCRRNDLVLLREGLQRGRLWQVKAARWNARANRYRFLGALPIRRVYFGSLPRSLARQHERAQEAVAAAKRLISKSARRPQFALVWVRLALPRADWARVIFKGRGQQQGLAGRASPGRRWLDERVCAQTVLRKPAEARAQPAVPGPGDLESASGQLPGTTRRGALLNLTGSESAA
jgi:hypothetical protein